MLGVEGLAGDNPREIGADFDDLELLESIDSQVRKKLFQGLKSLEGVKSQKDRHNLIRDLNKFINDEFRTESKYYMPGSDEIRRKRMNNKAKALVKGEKTGEPPRIENDSERLTLLKMLVEKGYVLDFKLEAPWHPVTFLNKNKLTTYPFNHEETVLYRGTNRHIFYNSEYSYEGDGRHTKSVLEIGNIEPSAEGGRGEGKEGEVAIYLGFLEAAKRYGIDKKRHEKGGAIAIELITNSDKLIFVQHGKPLNKSDDDRLNKNDVAESYPFFQLKNLGELDYMYGSPLKMREIALKSLNHSKEQTEKAEGQYRRRSWLMAKHYSGIPIGQIERIWDIEAERQNPYFVGTKDYIQSLKKSHPEKMPNSNQSPDNGIKAEIMNEIRNIRKVIEILEKIGNEIEVSTSFLERRIDDNRTLEVVLEYNIYLFILRWHLENNFEIDLRDRRYLDFSARNKLDNANGENIGLLGKKTSQIEQDIQNEVKFLNKKLKKEISHAKAENWNKEYIKKEKRFENRIENQVKQLVEELPFIRPSGVENDLEHIIESHAEKRIQKIFDEEVK